MDQLTKLLYCSCALALMGCGDDAGYSPDLPTGSRSVVQGGRQDIGEFRSIVASGKVPKPFMMLNMYFALFTATRLANQNECGAARAIEPMMRDAWQTFSQIFPDAASMRISIC